MPAAKPASSGDTRVVYCDHNLEHLAPEHYLDERKTPAQSLPIVP